MNTPLFLSYANNSFKDNPTNLVHFVEDAIQSSHIVSKDENVFSHLRLLAEKVISVKKDSIPTLSKVKGGDWHLSKGKTAMDFFMTVLAHNAAFGFLDHLGCEDPLCSSRKKHRKKKLKTMKCYECDQEFFRKVLDDIMDAEYCIGNHKRFIAFKNSYVDIPDLAVLLSLIDDHIKTEAKITIGESGVSRKYDHVFIRGMEMTSDKVNVFRGFLLSMAGYSLIDYLVGKNNNRRKLKKCRICQRFFIPNNTRREICTDNGCVKEYRRKMKQKQRSEDPVTYVS